MSSKRTLIMVGALVVGALAAFMILRYVNSVEDKAEAGQKTARVLVAQTPIAQGAKATQLIETSGVVLQERLLKELPSNAIRRQADIRGQVAQIKIAPGTVITAAMFENPGASPDSNSNILPEGMVAITTSTDKVRGVAGFLEPGSYVNLTLVGQCVGNNFASGDGAKGENGEEPVPCSTMVYQKAKILAIGQDTGAITAEETKNGEEQAPTSDLITFAVPPEAAQSIAFAGPGTLYMSLVRADYKPRPILPDQIGTPLRGIDGSTPYGGDPEALQPTDGETAGDS